MPYLCGLQAGSPVANATGIAAVIQSATVTLPEGGGLSSTAALVLTPKQGDVPLSMRFGFGVFSMPDEKLKLQKKPQQQRSIFYELISGPDPLKDRKLQQLGDPGDGFHTYIALFDPTLGQWAFLFDGMQMAQAQADAWKIQSQSQSQMTPAFLGSVTVLEADVLGTSASPCKFESCQVRVGNFFTDADFSAALGNSNASAKNDTSQGQNQGQDQSQGQDQNQQQGQNGSATESGGSTTGGDGGSTTYTMKDDVGQVGALDTVPNAFTISKKSAS